MSNVFGASSVSGAGFGAFAPEAPADPNQPAWVTSFQDTMKQIEEKGFGGYAKEINDRKLEEMRKKILDKMGLSEDDLNKMSPEGRASIEKMIAEEIRQQLSAQAEMRAKGKDSDDQGIDANNQASQVAGVTGASGKVSAADKAAKAALEAGAPNGFGAGMTLIQAMEARDAAVAGQPRSKALEEV